MVNRRCDMCREYHVLRRIEFEGVGPWSFCYECWLLLEAQIDTFEKASSLNREGISIMVYDMVRRYSKTKGASRDRKGPDGILKYAISELASVIYDTTG